MISRIKTSTLANLFSNSCKAMAIIAIAICIAGAVNAQTEPISRLLNAHTSNTPLIIVDGNELEGSLNSLNPKTIASITVLKDKSTIEQYGEKGKNGVIIITTKLFQAEKLDTPLILVDGEEFEGDISSISPESIESITILKNQSAVEQYGEKGRNGVVVVTTKK